MGQIKFNQGNQHPVVTEDQYIKRQQRCSMLVDVCSQMSRDWINQGRPHDKVYNSVTKISEPYKGTFKAKYANLCPNDERSNNPIKFEEYTIHQPIWTCFKFGVLPPFGPFVEPAAFIAYETAKPKTAYLVFRGSQTGADFGVDAMAAFKPNPYGGGQVAEGFLKYYQGCGVLADGTRPEQGNVTLHPVPGKTLYESLKEISHKHGGQVKELIITGHSLGSTTATFACTLACQQGWFEKVIGSISASPMVGDQEFANWFQTVKQQDNTMLNDWFWRLTNTADGVPKLPGGDYVPVGSKTNNASTVDFTEKYAGTLLYDSTPVTNVNNVTNNPAVAYPDPGSKFFKREATVNGTRIMAAGLQFGYHPAVPDAWLRKVARMYQLFVDPTGENIVAIKQKELIRILRGEVGTYHADEGPTIQRIGYGSGATYNPNPLLEENYAHWNLLPLYNGDPSGDPPYKPHVMNDFIWYQPTGVTPGDGNADATEVIEHTFHTLHMCGLPAKEMKTQPEYSSDWQTGPTFLAIQEAVNNNVFIPEGLPNWATNEQQFPLAVKEYLYLLNFCMFEYSSLWDGGSLAPEWSDDARTPTGILTNNPLGYALFEAYIKPCLANPTLEQINEIFQDGDTGNPNSAGKSGYLVSQNGAEHNPCCTYSYAINHPKHTRNPDIEDCSFPKDQ